MLNDLFCTLIEGCDFEENKTMEWLENADRIKYLCLVIGQFTERELDILKMLYIDEEKVKTVALKYGRSGTLIRHLANKCLRRLKVNYKLANSYWNNNDYLS